MATRSAEPLLVRILCSRYAGALAGVTLVTLFLGCMSVSLGGRTFQSATHDGSGCQVFVQEGDVTVPPGDQEVYYPVPYASTPNLEIDTCLRPCVLIEQRPDHFRLRNSGVFGVQVSWTARGVKTLPAVIHEPSAEILAAPTVPFPASGTAEPVPKAYVH